jgi:hypothetical protein
MCVSRISENAETRVAAEDQCGDWSLGFLVEGQREGEWLLLTEPTVLLIPFEVGCAVSSVESRDRLVPRGSLKLGFSSKFAVEELLIEDTTVPLV